jgi:hypothetical protein
MLQALRRAAARVLTTIALGSSAGCVGTGHDLNDVGALYRDARYEAAQAWVIALRADYPEMTPAQRALYHFLSGMTAYRLAQPDEAGHELALAAHAVREHPSALATNQLAVLYRTLEELTPPSAASR